MAFHREDDTASAVWEKRGTSLRSGRLFPLLLCICCSLLAAVLLAGCESKENGDEDSEGGNLDKPEEEYQKDANTSSMQWSTLGNTGVAEALENVGSNEVRQWIIQCPNLWSQEQLDNFGQGSPGEIKWKGSSSNGVSALVYEGTKNQLKQLLEKQDGALFVEEAVTVQVPEALRGAERRLEEQTFTNDRLWGLDRIDDEAGLDRSYNNFGMTGENTNVYVLDTGIRTTHTEFEGRALPALDVTVFPDKRCSQGDRTCASDVNGHGTHCAGTIAGKTVGVAKKAKVHAVKVLGDDGSGSNAGIIRAINFVAAEGQKPAVISMSLGCSRPCQSQSTAIAIDRANSAGVTVVVAAGNNGNTAQPDACAYSPASIPQAITVASITINRDQRSSFSNVGSCIDIFAPGSAIFSASPRSDSSFATLSGTSMACPHVSGVAALVLSQSPNLNPDVVAERILAGALTGKVQDDRGSPNKLLFIGNLAGAAPTPAPTQTQSTTPSPTPSTTPSQQYRKLGDGFCRTASNSRGTFTLATTDTLEKCQAECSAQASCVGVEFQLGSLTCELHRDALTRVSPATNSVCFVKVSQPPPPVVPPPIRFVQQISEGTCSDVGGRPINDVNLCQRAAAVLGLSDTIASTTTSVNRPEGCYVFNGFFLFMGVNPQSKGKGAETSTQGRSRHPICGFAS